MKAPRRYFSMSRNRLKVPLQILSQLFDHVFLELLPTNRFRKTVSASFVLVLYYGDSGKQFKTAAKTAYPMTTKNGDERF